MKSRDLTFKVDYPEFVKLTFGKKQFGEIKNRNSLEFSLKNIRQSTISPLPINKKQEYQTRKITPQKTFEINPILQHSRMRKLEEIRKEINLKIFQSTNTRNQAEIPLPAYKQPAIKRISPEKFIESITFTKSDLNISSKFIPTDRNTNVFLSNSSNKPLFPMIMYTKKSPKEIKTFPLIG